MLTVRRSFIPLALAAALTLTACGGGDTQGSGGQATTGADGKLAATTITILAPSYGATSQDDWQKVIDKFKTIQPNVTVELQIEGWDDFSSKVQARIQSNDLPDILNDNTFSGAASQGLLYPATEVLSQETLDSIEPALLANGVGSDGVQWAIPDVASARMLAYNTDLFEKAGIKNPPTTWKELEEDAQAISNLGSDIYGYGLPLGQEEAQVETSLWLWGAGGDWKQNGTLVANQPDAVEAFTQMKKLIDEGVVQPDAGATDRQQAADLFNNGKLGMMLSHSGLLSVTRKNFPDTHFDVAPIPAKDGGEVAFGVTDFIVAFNNKDANRKEATKQFLDLFYSDDMYQGWYSGTGLMPVTKTMIEDGKANDTENAKFYDALGYVKFLPVGDPHWDVLQKALQGTAGTIVKETPENVLTQIQAQLDAQS